MASWRMASVYRTLHRWKYTSASSNPIPIPRTRASPVTSTFKVTLTPPIYAARAYVSYIATTPDDDHPRRRRRSPPSARSPAAGRPVASGRALARGDAGTGGGPVGGRGHVSRGRGAATGLSRPPARRRGRARSGRAAGADPLARSRDRAAHGPCLHGVLHPDPRGGAGPPRAALAPGRPRRGAARIGALVAAPPARGRPRRRRSGTRPDIARCPTGPHRASHGVRPPHHPRSAGAPRRGIAHAGRRTRAPAPGHRAAPGGRGGAAVADRGNPARPPLGHGRGVERAVVPGRSSPGGGVARARAPGGGV